MEDIKDNSLGVAFQTLLVTIHMAYQEDQGVFPNHMVFPEEAYRSIFLVVILAPLVFLGASLSIKDVLIEVAFHNLVVAHNNQEFCAYLQVVFRDI